MSGKPDVWMPLFIGDLLKHTRRIDRADLGSYLNLIMDYWIHGPPPDDDHILARVAGCSLTEWRRTRRALAPFFQIQNGQWIQKRVEEERAKADKRKARAKVSAEGRWKAKKDAPSIAPRIARASPKHMLEGCSSPSQESDRANQGALSDSVDTHEEKPDSPFDGGPASDAFDGKEAMRGLMVSLAAGMSAKRAALRS